MVVTITFACAVMSFFIGYLGRNKKMGFWGHFFASLFLTPIIGMLLVIVSEKRSLHAGDDGE